jgi:transcriptional antiterminator RfaH
MDGVAAPSGMESLSTDDFVLACASPGDAMPILAAETAEFPAGLLDDIAPTDCDRRWWAVYTKSRQEKALARQLESLEVPFYLPQVPHESLIRGRRHTSLLPLFSGYLFLFGDDNERIKALGTKRVSHMLCAVDAQAMTRDLINIRTLIESGAPLTVESRLEPGRPVRVKSGALMGMEGRIVARRAGHALLVVVRFLQQGVSVQIDDFQVEPI